MNKKFQSNLSELINNKARLLLAVSAGVDSMVLAELCLKSKIEFGVAHCNFSLRDKESDDDQTFVEKWCQNHGIPFFTKKFETKKISQEQKRGIQETARVLRYDFFKSICANNNYNFIATAHHRDDSIETVIFNFSRGTGLSGITGIKDKKGGIIRPLLPFSKNEILAFAKENKTDFREDSSNVSTKYRRNFIRHEVVPVLKKMNPDFEKNIFNSIKRLAATDEIFKFFIAKIKNELLTEQSGTILLSKGKLRNLPQPKTILFEVIRDFGFNFAQAEDIFSGFDGQTGAVYFSDNYQLLNDRESLIIKNKKTDQTILSFDKYLVR